MTEPYYQDANVTLYHGDCLEIRRWLDADVLVTDPPYGINWVQSVSNNGARVHAIPNVIHGDTTPDLRDIVLDAWGSPPALVFGSWRVVRPSKTRQVLVWNKAGAFSATTVCAFFTVHEEIYVLGEGFRKSSTPLHSVITTREVRSRQPNKVGHPTPKPVQLMEILIDRCPPGVIADPFAGSGSTLLAARNLGRKAIGVEIEERYCEIAARRLDQLCFDFTEDAR